jgi:chemotaxis protein CheX
MDGHGGLAGELRGVLRLGGDEKKAVRITSKMLRGPLPGADEQTADALGEVCNRIAGSCKHKVNGDLANVALSPPSVVTGKDYRVHRQESESLHSLRVTFTFDGASIYLSLELLK